MRQSSDAIVNAARAVFAAKAPPRAYPLFRGPTLESKLADVEASLGLAFSGFLTFAAVIAVMVLVPELMIYRKPPLPSWWWAVLVPSGMAIIVLEWKTFATMGHGIEDVPHPRPVWIALRQSSWPAALRGVVALWWVAHAVALIVIAHSLVESYHFVNPTKVETVMAHLLQITVLFMAAYASNAFFLFGVAVFIPSEPAVQKLWRWRIIGDLVIALAGAYAANAAAS